MCAVTMEYPYGYTYLTISTDKNETVIRIKEITDQDAVKKWVQEFSLISKTTWRKAATYPNSGRRNKYRVDLRCSRFTDSRARGVRPSKNTNCPAKLNVIIKMYRENSKAKDDLLPEWPCIIIFRRTHNHSLVTAEIRKENTKIDDVMFDSSQDTTMDDDVKPVNIQNVEVMHDSSENAVTEDIKVNIEDIGVTNNTLENTDAEDIKANIEDFVAVNDRIENIENIIIPSESSSENANVKNRIENIEVVETTKSDSPFKNNVDKNERENIIVDFEIKSNSSPRNSTDVDTVKGNVSDSSIPEISTEATNVPILSYAEQIAFESLIQRIRDGIQNQPHLYVPAVKKMIYNAKQRANTDSGLLSALRTFGQRSLPSGVHRISSTELIIKQIHAYRTRNNNVEKTIADTMFRKIAPAPTDPTTCSGK